MAIDMGAEIESQNRQVDQINCKGMSLRKRIKSVKERATELLGEGSSRKIQIEMNKRIESSYRKPRAEFDSISSVIYSMTERLDLPESDSCQTQEVKPTKKSSSSLRSKVSGAAQWFSRKFKRKMFGMTCK